MGRQHLLDEGRAGARKSEDKDRLGQVLADPRARQGGKARRRKEAAQALDQLLGVVVEIDEARYLAAQALALGEGGKGVLVAPDSPTRRGMRTVWSRPGSTGRG
jgi:hypothetical protein